MRILISTILVLVCLSSFSQTLSSQIDKLQSIKEVERFYFEQDLLDYSKVYAIGKENIDSICKHSSTFLALRDSLGIQEDFIKHDFDGNGHTDLLFSYNWNLYDDKFWNYAVAQFSYESDSSKRFNIIPGPYLDCLIPDMKSDSLIDIYYIIKESGRLSKSLKVRKHVFIYKFDAFIEYNPSPKSYEIEKIELGVRYYGKSQISNKLKAKRSLRKFEGNRLVRVKDKASIPLKNFQELCRLLSYADFENLEDDYLNMYATGDTYYELKILYNGGQEKSIVFNDNIGPASLHLIRQKIGDLLSKLDWK